MRVLLACVLMAASPARASGAQPPEATTPAAGAVRVPKVFPAVPQRPILDLGPVFAIQGLEPHSALTVVADQLGADGFVLESRQIHEVYPTLFTGTGGRVVTALLTGTIPLGEGYAGPAMRRTQGTFYRAFRFREGTPPAVSVQAAPISQENKERLTVATLQEQLHSTLSLLASGAIDTATYEKLRIYLLRATGS